MSAQDRQDHVITYGRQCTTGLCTTQDWPKEISSGGVTARTGLLCRIVTTLDPTDHLKADTTVSVVLFPLKTGAQASGPTMCGSTASVVATTVSMARVTCYCMFSLVATQGHIGKHNFERPSVYVRSLLLGRSPETRSWPNAVHPHTVRRLHSNALLPRRDRAGHVLCSPVRP
jgi:hypothetical protein